MRERVIDRSDLIAEDDARSEASTAVRCRIGLDRHFGQAPQSAPDTESRPLLEEDRPGPLDHEHPHRTLRQHFPRPWRRQLCDTIVDACDAIMRDGTGVAAWRSTRADGGAEIHQRLRVGLDV